MPTIAAFAPIKIQMTKDFGLRRLSYLHVDKNIEIIDHKTAYQKCIEILISSIILLLQCDLGIYMY